MTTKKTRQRSQTPTQHTRQPLILWPSGTGFDNRRDLVCTAVNGCRRSFRGASGWDKCRVLFDGRETLAIHRNPDEITLQFKWNRVTDVTTR
jgi:hypothetical protein